METNNSLPKEFSNSLFKNIHAFIVLINEDFVVKKTNFYRVSGLNKGSDVEVKRIGDLLRCKSGMDACGCGTGEFCSKCPLRGAITHAFKENQDLTNVVVPMTLYKSDQKNDFQDYIFSFFGALLDSDIGKEMLVTIIDVTKERLNEQKLLREKKQSEENAKKKSIFISNMSHEVKTPLNAICGFAELLINAEDHEEKQLYINVINDNKELLLNLVNDILDISRIEVGVRELEYVDTDINQLISETVQIFKLHNMKSEKVDILFDNPVEKYILKTDRNRLKQILTNLVGNALKFTKEGSVRLAYEVRLNDVYFTVVDMGPGIPEDKQQVIFDYFVRLNNDVPGTGLGLSICKMIIDKFGGNIGVNSKLGQGSTFWFTLPIQPQYKE
jgi:signal transduction histidine kinase